MKIDENVPYYNRCADGSSPPKHILDMLNRTLTARAFIRMVIAEQDRRIGDSWAEQTNIRTANQMIRDAAR